MVLFIRISGSGYKKEQHNFLMNNFMIPYCQLGT